MEKRQLNDTYTLLEQIGSGGGGIVYKAYHNRLKTYVVAKQIKEGVKNILKSRAEADILKKMKHTYLPRVYDFLEIDGEIYTVMDYIPGESLDKPLKKGEKFSQKQVLKWAVQLAEALDYLHRQIPPIVHSDIKPANIMLTPEGDICLIDFNISLVFDSSMKTATGISGGYAPPEQYHDKVVYYRMTQPVSDTMTMTAETETMTDETKADCTMTASETRSKIEQMMGKGVDTRSDIYSLGATLYHLLTGKKPNQNFEEIIAIDQCEIEISEGFSHIIKKMMELDPEKRYQDGTELLNAFRHIYDLDSEYCTYRRKRKARWMMIGIAYVAGIALIASGTVVIKNAKNIQYNQLIMSAEQLMNEEKYDDAEVQIEDAVNLLPIRIEAYGKEAACLYQTGKYEDCINYIEDLIRNAPYKDQTAEHMSTYGDLLYTLGNAYLEVEDYGDAVQTLQRALEAYSQNSLYYRDYAIALAKTGNTEEAEQKLKQATEMGLGETSVYMVQGEIAAAKGEYETAEEYLQKTITTADTDELRRRAILLCDKVYRELGNAYIDQDILLLEQEEQRSGGGMTAKNLTERLADAYTRKADAEGEHGTGYYQKALDKFFELYESGMVTEQVMENIAILQEQLKEYDQAEEMIQTIIDQYPDDYKGYKRMAFLEADRQQTLKNEDRNYQKVKEYYDLAKERYQEKDQDQEMQMLEIMIQELKNGNWLS